MPATRVRHTLSSSTSRTCTSEGEELAIAFAPYATSLDVWESNRRLSHERRRLTRRRRRRPRALRTRLHLAGCFSRVRRRSRRSELTRVRAGRLGRAPSVCVELSWCPHTQNGRSFTRTFLPFRTNDVARSAVGIAIPSISPLCGGRECFVRVRGVFEFISTVSRKTVLSPGTTPKHFDSQNPAWHLEPRRF